MRLVKGSKVEILVNTQGHGVEWHCARIISGNGHSYNVEYDNPSVTAKPLSNRVPRKFIRPCPPAIENIGSWECNDTVEVWDAGCWKEATVLTDMTEEFYLVRVHGSCMELKVHKILTRICQSWQNGQWIISPKGPAKSRVVKFSQNLIPNNYKTMPEVQQAKNVCSPGLDASCLHLYSPSTLKSVSSYVGDYPRKRSAVVIMGESKRFKAVSAAPLLEKVDAIAYQQNTMGEKYMHYSFTNETRKEKPCNIKTHFPETIQEPDFSSNMSSVGSCSVISGSANEFFGDTLAGPCQDDVSLRSDAESLDVKDVGGFYGDMLAGPCRSDDEDTSCSDDAESIDAEDVDEGCTFFPKQVVVERIHRLELIAYHRTLGAMYASGPLSWEKEELLTNLRISLNISNDEHLMGIKNLVFSGQNF